MARKFGKSGNEAERLFRKLCESYGIELEDGSPSKASDFTIFPNVLAEVKSTTTNSFSFKVAHRKGKEFSHGESQWLKLRSKKEAFPWVEIVYPVYYLTRKEWRWFILPEEPKPLHYNRGMPIDDLMILLGQKQRKFSEWVEGRVSEEEPQELVN